MASAGEAMATVGEAEVVVAAEMDSVLQEDNQATVDGQEVVGWVAAEAVVGWVATAGCSIPLHLHSQHNRQTRTAHAIGNTNVVNP